MSSESPQLQTLALNNAANLQSLFGMHNIKIEIVAFGPGLSMLTTKSHEAKRVQSMAMHDITFSACHNTMKAMEKKTGHKVILLKGVGVVPSGITRIVELQEQGYSYVRP
ncbi:MAG: DsrE family protein [Acidiferrobacterales bacterium]